jgi:hypothetical protein
VHKAAQPGPLQIYGSLGAQLVTAIATDTAAIVNHCQTVHDGDDLLGTTGHTIAAGYAAAPLRHRSEGEMIGDERPKVPGEKGVAHGCILAQAGRGWLKVGHENLGHGSP